PSTRVRTAEPISFDALGAHWRVALDVAADALLVADRCRRSLGFSEHELGERKARLTRERDDTARLLALVARDDHAQVHRVTAQRATRQMLGSETRGHAGLVAHYPPNASSASARQSGSGSASAAGSGGASGSSAISSSIAGPSCTSSASAAGCSAASIASSSASEGSSPPSGTTSVFTSTRTS